MSSLLFLRVFKLFGICIDQVSDFFFESHTEREIHGSKFFLDLSVRAMNCLNNANIKLLGELCTKSESRMLKFRNFGKKSLEEIKEKLAAMNLSLGMTFKKEVADLINADAEQLKNSKKEEA